MPQQLPACARAPDPVPSPPRRARRGPSLRGPEIPALRGRLASSVARATSSWRCRWTRGEGGADGRSDPPRRGPEARSLWPRTGTGVARACPPAPGGGRHSRRPPRPCSRPAAAPGSGGCGEAPRAAWAALQGPGAFDAPGHAAKPSTARETRRQPGDPSERPPSSFAASASACLPPRAQARARPGLLLPGPSSRRLPLLDEPEWPWTVVRVVYRAPRP